MARAYTAAGAAYTLPAAATDIHTLTTGLAMVIEIDELDVNQTSATTVANVSMQVLRYMGSYSVATGSAVTPHSHLFGDNATVVTALYNGTVQVSAGSNFLLYADAINIINGWQKLPAPEDRWSYTLSQAFVWRITAFPTPGGGTFSSSVAYRETV